MEEAGVRSPDPPLSKAESSPPKLCAPRGRDVQSTTQRDHGPCTPREGRSTTQRDHGPCTPREGRSTTQRDHGPCTPREGRSTTQRDHGPCTPREGRSTTQRDHGPCTPREGRSVKHTVRPRPGHADLFVGLVVRVLFVCWLVA